MGARTKLQLNETKAYVDDLDAGAGTGNGCKPAIAHKVNRAIWIPDLGAIGIQHLLLGDGRRVGKHGHSLDEFGLEQHFNQRAQLEPNSECPQWAIPSDGAGGD